MLVSLSLRSHRRLVSVFCGSGWTHLGQVGRPSQDKWSHMNRSRRQREPTHVLKNTPTPCRSTPGWTSKPKTLNALSDVTPFCYSPVASNSSFHLFFFLSHHLLNANNFIMQKASLETWMKTEEKCLEFTCEGFSGAHKQKRAHRLLN